MVFKLVFCSVYKDIHIISLLATPACVIAHNSASVLIQFWCEWMRNVNWWWNGKLWQGAQPRPRVCRPLPGSVATLPHCRSQGRVSQWWVSQVETSLSPDKTATSAPVYVDNLVTTGPSLKSPSNGGVQLEPVITNGNGNSSAAGQGGLVEVDMDRVSTTPAVPSPAPLSSMSATPDSHVEAGTDIGNVDWQHWFDWLLSSVVIGLLMKA